MNLIEIHPQPDGKGPAQKASETYSQDDSISDEEMDPTS